MLDQRVVADVHSCVATPSVVYDSPEGLVSEEFSALHAGFIRPEYPTSSGPIEPTPGAVLRSLLLGPQVPTEDEHIMVRREFLLVHDHIIRETVRRIHRNPDVVDDITQDVWAAVIDGVSRMSVDRSLRSITAWIVVIADRIARKNARAHSKRREQPLATGARERLIDRGLTPDVAFGMVEDEQDLRNAIVAFAERLPPGDRQIVVRHWVDGHSLGVIAREMNVTEDAAWGHMRRVSLSLADFLRRRGYRRREEISLKKREIGRHPRR